MMFARLPRSPRGLARATACLGACAGLLAVAACSSSPPSHFYTLGANGAPSAAGTISAPSLLIEVAPVDVPSQVAKNQLVVQTGPTQVQVLEQERWASLPGDDRCVWHAVSGRHAGLSRQCERATVRIVAGFACLDRCRVERALGAQRNHHDVPQRRQRARDGQL
jgi:hypothetical protein